MIVSSTPGKGIGTNSTETRCEQRFVRCLSLTCSNGDATKVDASYGVCFFLHRGVSDTLRVGVRLRIVRSHIVSVSRNTENRTHITSIQRANVGDGEEFFRGCLECYVSERVFVLFVCVCVSVGGWNAPLRPEE